MYMTTVSNLLYLVFLKDLKLCYKSYLKSYSGWVMRVLISKARYIKKDAVTIRYMGQLLTDLWEQYLQDGS